MNERILTFSESIKEAISQSIEKDDSVFLMGLGANYVSAPGLKNIFPDKIFDTPNSEFVTTSACVGAAIAGLKPIIHHDRVEFGLFAADAIFTQASKWNYSFGGNNPVPLVVRLTVGRQWGTGPQHSQSMYSAFGNVTGLKAVIPSTPAMAKGLMISAIQDRNPVVFLEHLWIKNIKQHVSEEFYSVPLDRVNVHKPGKDLTLISYGDGLITSIQALEMIDDVDVELIDLISLNPIDYEGIFRSVKKTGNLLVVDTCNDAFSIGSEIISKVSQECFKYLKNPPVKISAPNVPVPTAHSLTKDYYPTRLSVANKICEMFHLNEIQIELSFDELNFGTKALIS